MVLINNEPATKMIITKFEGLFSHGLQDSYREVLSHDKAAMEQGISVFLSALERQ